MTTDSQILTALRKGESVSGAELAHQLGISRAAVWSRIEDLRRLGYDIEASPHHGYRLVRSPDLLHADDLESQLPPHRVIGRHIIVYSETASTNDVVEKLARDGTDEGVVVFAESQSKGRGRLGRRWMSPAGKGLWFSVLLRPALRPQEATQLTVAAAVALARAVTQVTGIRPDIKWPNDLLVNGRKIAGVLTEMSAEPDQMKHVTLGIGLDVNHTASEFPREIAGVATSLRIASGHAVSRPDLATAILRELDAVYRQVRSGHFAAVADEWQAHCTTIGQRVLVRAGERKLHGYAESLDADGALLLRTQHGHLERITGGDVSIIR